MWYKFSSFSSAFGDVIYKDDRNSVTFVNINIFLYTFWGGGGYPKKFMFCTLVKVLKTVNPPLDDLLKRKVTLA